MRSRALTAKTLLDRLRAFSSGRPGSPAAPGPVSSAGFRFGAVLFAGLFVSLFAGCGAPPAERAPEESSLPASSPASASSELIGRSIAYHDPAGVWGSATVELRLVESRPERPARTTEIRLEAGAGRVTVTRDSGNGAARFEVRGEEIVSRSVDGETALPEEVFAEAGLGAETVMRLRDYYLYLWGLPMKLRDSGAIVDPEPTPEPWEGQEALRVRVTYDPEVGGDTWYFFFDPETARLLGYRFHHDETKNDGEYIRLDGEISGGGLRLPAKRSWYWNDGRGFLGEDEAVALEVVPGGDSR